jgi:hypothetical protein
MWGGLLAAALAAAFTFGAIFALVEAVATSGRVPLLVKDGLVFGAFFAAVAIGAFALHLVERRRR